MPLHVLKQQLWFPPVSEALPDGLLAVGGDLSTERLLLAYKNGIFPWYDGNIPLWWCPDPRFVLFPAELKVSKSMAGIIRKQTFDFRINSAFDQVITACMESERKGQDGTWINKEIVQAYSALHRLGFAHSAEAWHNGRLVGGLYGVRIGNMFFGESMFSTISNASKLAFILHIQQLQREGVVLVDCQVYTEHLASLGARMIPRDEFLIYLQQNA